MPGFPPVPHVWTDLTPSFPRIYRTAVARLLGQPVFSSSAPCPLCEQTMDPLGDHPLCCNKSRDRITRHNRLRNLVFKLADTGLLAPELEKLGILGVTDKTRRRPGDVSIKSWSFRRGLAIDVAVIHPLAASHLGKAEPCESYAQTQKIDRYAAAFVHSDYDFAPVIFETSGALNKEGETVLKQIIRFASKREGITHTVYAARAWARLSCCVQAASAQQILNRDFVDWSIKSWSCRRCALWGPEGAKRIISRTPNAVLVQKSQLLSEQDRRRPRLRIFMQAWNRTTPTQTGL